MKFLQAILNFYIQSSIHVALAVTSLAVITVLEVGFVPEPVVMIFIFFGAVAGYNFVKYLGFTNRHHLDITSNLTLIRAFSVFCFLGMIYFGYFLPIDVLITAAIFGSLTFLYAVPLYKKRNLRSLKGLKIFIIALVWMGIVVLVPLEYHNLRFSLKVFFQCVEIFLFVIVLTLPFEIRDLKHDENELATIPQQLGIRKTKWLGTLLLIVIAVIAFQTNYFSDSQLYIQLFVIAVTLLALWFSKKEQGEYYAAFWVEGIPVLWLVLILVF